MFKKLICWVCKEFGGCPYPICYEEHAKTQESDAHKQIDLFSSVNQSEKASNLNPESETKQNL